MFFCFSLKDDVILICMYIFRVSPLPHRETIQVDISQHKKLMNTQISYLVSFPPFILKSQSLQSKAKLFIHSAFFCNFCNTSLLHGEDQNIISFTNKSISIKIYNKNYLPWCQHVDLTVSGQGLKGILDGVATAPTSIGDANGVRCTNQAYIVFLCYRYWTKIESDDQILSLRSRAFREIPFLLRKIDSLADRLPRSKSIDQGCSTCSRHSICVVDRTVP